MIEGMTNDIVLWGAALGLLVGIIWSLRYVVVLDRKIEAIDWKIERTLARIIGLEEKLLNKKSTTVAKPTVKKKASKRKR